MTATASKKLMISKTTASEIRRRCRTGNLYAILDACDEPDIFVKVCEMGDEKMGCLYSGDARCEFSNLAPYLVPVDEELFDWIHEKMSGRFWGIFIGCRSDRETLRRNFKKFLKVENAEGRELFFRFYDPRVLPTFLRTATDNELQDFFGPAHLFWTEWESEPGKYIQFRNDGAV